MRVFSGYNLSDLFWATGFFANPVLCNHASHQPKDGESFPKIDCCPSVPLSLGGPSVPLSGSNQTRMRSFFRTPRSWRIATACDSFTESWNTSKTLCSNTTDATRPAACETSLASIASNRIPKALSEDQLTLSTNDPSSLLNEVLALYGLSFIFKDRSATPAGCLPLSRTGKVNFHWQFECVFEECKLPSAGWGGNCLDCKLRCYSMLWLHICQGYVLAPPAPIIRSQSLLFS